MLRKPAEGGYTQPATGFGRCRAKPAPDGADNGGMDAVRRPDARSSCPAVGRWRRGSAGGLVACLIALGIGVAVAAPAPWYYWRSKVDGKRVCAQVTPGPGWERDSAPFDGPGCQAKPRVFVIPAR